MYISEETQHGLVIEGHRHGTCQKLLAGSPVRHPSIRVGHSQIHMVVQDENGDCVLPDTTEDDAGPVLLNDEFCQTFEYSYPC